MLSISFRDSASREEYKQRTLRNAKGSQCRMYRTSVLSGAKRVLRALWLLHDRSFFAEILDNSLNETEDNFVSASMNSRRERRVGGGAGRLKHRELCVVTADRRLQTLV